MISGISVSILSTVDYPLFNHVAGKILRTVKPIYNCHPWEMGDHYIYVYRFPLNSTGCWVHSTLVVPPFDCHEKVNWFDDFPSIHFPVYLRTHIEVCSRFDDQFVDRYKEVKYSGIKHFGRLKGDRIRYREETALYRSTLPAHMAIFSESCSVAVVYRVTDIYRAVTYWFDCSSFFFFAFH